MREGSFEMQEPLIVSAELEPEPEPQPQPEPEPQLEPPPKPLHTLDVDAVSEWLESIHLGDYAEKFREQQMDGPALVRLRMLLEDPDPLKHAVWRRQLEDECGLRTLGHFLCFWQHLQQTA